MKLIHLITVVAITVTGCASQQATQNRVSESHHNYKWAKAGATKTDLKKDKYDCETDAQQRQAMSVQALNQYKYSRMHMGIAGLGLEEPEDFDDDAKSALVQHCLEGHGWNLLGTDPLPLGPHDDDDDVQDQHTFVAR